ncbi:hypothetical protein S40285_04675 [Stachybotrys chlorohalonatus IBT 40285]|uniref:Uncharacterized protein n=1 Tax=Stachybotrys chlorohalonatus (strain IBT 40285) TaxID=1283841 RepID=A0A084QPI3_STAC4|nr:hypothetical protein S40285_04675 [Stachybotrys chlorohalonata IBT 40285]
MSMFPDPRRVVTGHDDEGNAIVVADSQIPSLPTPVNCNFAELYQTSEFPSSNDVWEDPMQNNTQSLANSNGIVLRVVDFKANTTTSLWILASSMLASLCGMHFHSLYACEIEQRPERSSVLEKGVETTVRAGDVVVQRGTMHAWHNRTDKPARVFFVLASAYIKPCMINIKTNEPRTAAKPVEIGGKLLGTHGFTPDEVKPQK